MANYQELANLVWNVADDVLRGLFKPHEYGDITLPFLVLRRLDCILDEDGRKEKAINTYNEFKDKVPEEALPPIITDKINTNFYNISQYDLSRLTEDPTNIRLNFENYLNGFSQDVRDIIVELYTNFAETEHCKIYPNDFFGYTKVTVERPLIERQEVFGEEKEFVVKDKKGNPKPDTKLRDYERVPLAADVEDYYQREVKPHVPDSWIDRQKDKVGYEVNFNRYFYQYTPLRSLKEIADELLALERKSEGILNAVLEL